MRPIPFTALMVGLLSLSACTVVVQPNSGLSGSSSNLISRFVPDRGQGSSYMVGDAVNFHVTTRTAGYVTIAALNSNGIANVLVRDAYVDAGTTTFPRAQDSVNFNAAPPRGLQRVRLIFTKVRPTTQLIITGTYDGTRWNSVTNEYLAPYQPADRDVQETYLYIR